MFKIHGSFFYWYFLALIVLSNGCASTYHAMPLKAMPFLNSQKTDGLEYSYKYDVLYSYGNNKYAKKEKKRGINVIALKLTNKTNENINLNSLRLKTGNTEVIPMNNSIVAKQLRQCAPCYLFIAFYF